MRTGKYALDVDCRAISCEHYVGGERYCELDSCRYTDREIQGLVQIEPVKKVLEIDERRMRALADLSSRIDPSAFAEAAREVSG